MTDLDALLQHCLAAPSDTTQRLIFCDALAQTGETELETALRAKKKGEQIIRRVHALADKLNRVACVRLLWAVVIADADAQPTSTIAMVPVPAVPVAPPLVAPGHPWKMPAPYEMTPDWTYRPPGTAGESHRVWCSGDTR